MNDSALSTTTAAAKIEAKIDKSATGALAIGTGGSLSFANLNEIMEVAKVVAIAEAAIPKHLRNNVGACLAICIQASEWQLSPFAVANKTYVVNDRIAFEAQLIAAVILKRAPIIGRISYEYSGEGTKRRCKTSAKLQEDGSFVDYTSPEVGSIPIKNSPLWKNDPDQQLGYFSVRAMCRRHFPDVILGIYTPEEMEEAIDVPAKVTTLQQGTVGSARSITELRSAEQQKATEPKNPVLDVQPEAEQQQTETQPEPPKEEQKPAEPKAPKGPTAAELLKQIITKGAEINAGKVKINKTLIAMEVIKEGESIEGLPAKQLADILDAWDNVKEKILNPE